MSKLMFIVSLAVPTMVAGVLRHPVEGPLTVDEKEAERLYDNNLLAEEPTAVPVESQDDEPGGQTEEELLALTVPDLHILVTKEGIPLNDATKKADIVAAILKHREEKSAA